MIQQSVLFMLRNIRVEIIALQLAPHPNAINWLACLMVIQMVFTISDSRNFNTFLWFRNAHSGKRETDREREKGVIHQ